LYIGLLNILSIKIFPNAPMFLMTAHCLIKNLLEAAVVASPKNLPEKQSLAIPIKFHYYHFFI